MIPRLNHPSEPSPVPAGFFERLIEAGFSGDIETQVSSRTAYATDNSIYQVEPSAVLFPKGTQDLKTVASILSEPDFAGIVVAPRGGGTGTNGQSLTSGVVIDCSRHMNRILEIDPVRRVARVQAGVVKDQLNVALKPYGLFFAPELSTSNRATIGGMISTDACGQGSCLYGKTSNHVLGLRVVLIDGTEWWSRPLAEEALGEVLDRPDRIGEIHRTVERITREKRERIQEIFPNLNRYLTGYDLAHVHRPDGSFDLNSILCGSEGTLALISEAEINLVPIPAHVALVNILYSDFNTALEDACDLVALEVASIETIDEKVMGLARNDIGWNSISHYFPDKDGRTNGINIVELVADDLPELERKLAQVSSALQVHSNFVRLGFTVTHKHADIEAIWTMRKRAVGLLGNVDGSVRPVPFVEDTAVPPENLAAFIREFRALLDGAGLSYGMFGHVDAGVLHVRPALDLVRTDHVPLVREISDAVFHLTRKYGGVLWGEHGKGVRSEYVPEFFGDLYPSLQDIKRAFDPRNRLNPGKIATPDDTPLLKIDEVTLRGTMDRKLGNDIRTSFDNAAYCNGNGACFDFDQSSPMCPSFKATRDRRQSPKGRASLMREWLRLLAERDIDPRKESILLRGARSLTHLPYRIFNSLNPMNAGDFSHEVKAAMVTCLACKACLGQCPVKVNVPAFRSRFLELYYGRYLRPIKNPLIGSIETTMPWLSRLGPGYGLITATRPGKWLMARMGLTAMPDLAPVSLAKAARRLGIGIATSQTLGQLTPAQRENVVVFVVDVFTAHFDPQVALAAIGVARKIGMLPLLSAPHVNGKPLHVNGYLARFEKAAARTAVYLQGLANQGVTLVGLDPSMTLTFRSEYKLLANKGFTASVLLPQEWLASQLPRLRAKGNPAHRARMKLLLHCTERTNADSAIKSWRETFGALGHELHVENVGCCGMAGTFGHETANRPVSEKLYDMSWRSAIEGSGADTIVMATGYSCRSQVKIISDRSVAHPIEIIDGLLD